MMKLGLIILFAFTVTGFAADVPISFQHIPPGETIEVSFKSTGCFHDESFVFIFQGGEVKVYRMEAGWRKPMGTATLSKSQLSGLDHLMNFYRERRPGGCTTSDRIVVGRKKGDDFISRESFKDDTCATYEMKELTTFTEIVSKLEKKK